MGARGRVAGVAIAVLVVAGCAHGNHASVRVSPATAAVDAPVTVDISGIPPGRPVNVTATAKDPGGTSWSATATYTADSKGTVSLRQQPVSGSYRGVNPMGLFESMTPARATEYGFLTALLPTPRGYRVTLTAKVAGKVVATKNLDREVPTAQGVTTTVESLASTGVDGLLALPVNTSRTKPAVLVLGGSEGGLDTSLAAELLAERGYPALALAYFGVPGLPTALANIPLEYFARALTLLSHQPGVDRNHMVVWGDSRGSEAALLTGADYPNLVHGVIASVPSSFVNAGYPDPDKPAWTWQGKPVQPGSAIPVERIDGPIFTVCGGQDAVWSSCTYAAAITKQRDAHGLASHDIALNYPAAGHFVGPLIPYTSEVTTTLETGGTPLADADGRDEGWPRLLTFLATL